MQHKYPPVIGAWPHMLHGGDYNPDQWIETPEVWDEDMRLARLAGCNTFSVGIFSWSMLEPREGQFTFDWLDRILEAMADNHMVAMLATPAAAKPAWMPARYPEVMRVDETGRRLHHGGRANHCPSSPVYRDKSQHINRHLAERYADHPALGLWHVNNEYGGACYCERCRANFRDWLRKRYDGDLDKLNHAWWTRFWSHTYTDFEQIDPPGPLGEGATHALELDWRRFVTELTIDFFENEAAPLRQLTPDVPVTTNFMGLYPGLDYRRFARHVDVVCWDSYPNWTDREDDLATAVQVSFIHNLYRRLKGGRPFLLMESTPSTQNWKPINKLKRPGMLHTEALQAVAHGSDSVQYFQWRKSRGGAEKFHGAVVDHVGHEHTRVFDEVASVGRTLAALDDVVGTTTPAEVAIVYDWENRWAIDAFQGAHATRRNYPERCCAHYRPYWSMGVPVDVVGTGDPLDDYRLVIAPMLYMLAPGVAEALSHFVERGGTLVTTYLTGWVDQNDLCILGGVPGPLREVLGVWAEELDTLYDDETVPVKSVPDNSEGLQLEYSAHTFCELVHAQGAEVVAEYAGEFYAGRPALTVNRFGKGKAWMIASRNDEAFLTSFHRHLVGSLSIRRTLDSTLPRGTTAQLRTDGTHEWVFVMNVLGQPATVALDEGPWSDAETGQPTGPELELPAHGTHVLKRPARRATQ